MAPGDLTVIMGVQVDKARRGPVCPGVDLFLALAGDVADFRDAAVGDRDISFEQVRLARRRCCRPRITKSELLT